MKMTTHYSNLPRFVKIKLNKKANYFHNSLVLNATNKTINEEVYPLTNHKSMFPPKHSPIQLTLVNNLLLLIQK